ncbi:Fic family protein [Candidatus Rhodoluna planktonica]|uniref:Fic family protein n=1 Tax=Candidatus Rhodoluna planktonica TaxID=535712 RepID=UPI0008DA4195|nr:Fic family protein [Candidatus Rhodoluna planktonica]
MGYFIKRQWQPEPLFGYSKQDLKPGIYRAYVPDELELTLPALGPAASEAAERALRVLIRADEKIAGHGSYLNHLLIRSESISSSWIEGNQISPKKLAIAELTSWGSQTALDVIANVKATEAAISQLAEAKTISVANIEQLQHIIEPGYQLGIRREQNFVGGVGFSPLRAEFVPPPETEVLRLLKNLALFVSQASGNAVVKAAIAHAQFETIHPFIDGNGRTGRALIHTVLKRSGVVQNTLIPISTVFATNTNSYISGLSGFRASPPQLDNWIIGFSEACELAANVAVNLANQVGKLDAQVLEQLIAFRAANGVNPSLPRADAVTLKILRQLAGHPVLTVDDVANRFAISKTAAQRALTELADAKILAKTKDQKGRLVCYSADQYLALAALAERNNRAGGHDTAVVKPKGGPGRPAPSVQPARPAQPAQPAQPTVSSEAED